MKNKTVSIITIVLSAVAVVLAVLDAGGTGVWLSASTWLIVAVVLGIWAIYARE